MRHLLSVVLLALPLAAWAQADPIRAFTEAEAVRFGLARADLSDLERGTVEAAEADALAAGLLPNPTLGYSRDRNRGTPGATEETWQIAQTFDVSGRRGLRREAADRRVDAANAGNTLRRSEVAAEIRHRFHETLFKQETVRATKTWTQRFIRVESLVEKLAKAGEASGYDRRRLTRERQTAQARLSTEQADLDRAAERLAALIGLALLFTRLWPGVEGSLAHAHHVIGSLVLTVVSIAAAEVARPARWLIVPLGAGLILVPFVFAGNTSALLVSVVAGAALMALSIRRGQIQERYGAWDRVIS